MEKDEYLKLMLKEKAQIEQSLHQQQEVSDFSRVLKFVLFNRVHWIFDVKHLTVFRLIVESVTSPDNPPFFVVVRI